MGQRRKKLGVCIWGVLHLIYNAFLRIARLLQQEWINLGAWTRKPSPQYALTYSCNVSRKCAVSSFFHWVGSGFILQGLQNVPVASISSPPPLHLRNIPINQITNTLCSQFQNQKTTLSHAWHPGIWKAPETTGAQGISNQRPGPATPFKLNHPGRTVTQFHCHSLSPHKISKALNPRRTERN